MQQAVCAFAVAEKAQIFQTETCAAMHQGERMEQIGDRVEAIRHKCRFYVQPNHEAALKLLESVSGE